MDIKVYSGYIWLLHLITAKLKAYVNFVIVLALCGCSNESEQTQEINPKAIEYNNLGVNQLLSDSEKAIIYLDSALQIEPYYATAYLNKINAFNQLSQFDSALSTAIKYSEIPNFPIKNYALVAMCYERTSQFEMSISCYTKALRYFEVSEWEKDPLISQIDLALFTTFIEGKEAGIEILRQILSKKNPTPEEADIIDRIKNEILYYQGGGYLEIMQNDKVKVFCVTEEERESFEQKIKEAGINFEGWSSNSIETGRYRYKIKEKFLTKAKEIGIKECEIQTQKMNQESEKYAIN